VWRDGNLKLEPGRICDLDVERGADLTPHDTHENPVDAGLT
jgi:hypothetical protein